MATARTHVEQRAARRGGRWSAAAAVVAVAVAAGCEREERGFRVDPPSAAAAVAVPLSTLQPGEPTPYAFKPNPYEENAQAMSEGKQLYQAWNCVGCHAHGGGGMGPALIDDKWIYGSEPEQIVSTIIQGRPNGMPSFRGKIPDYQVWELAAYVRSISGLTSKGAASSRDDHMNANPPENSKEPEKPNDAGVPKSAERPG
ncbi:MAG: cytochrome c class [Phycisphaerales bacterium]|nr:cytochrome c class [Phycisphaerales bacterium]